MIVSAGQVAVPRGHRFLPARPEPATWRVTSPMNQARRRATEVSGNSFVWFFLSGAHIRQYLSLVLKLTSHIRDSGLSHPVVLAILCTLFPPSRWRVAVSIFLGSWSNPPRGAHLCSHFATSRWTFVLGPSSSIRAGAICNVLDLASIDDRHTYLFIPVPLSGNMGTNGFRL